MPTENRSSNTEMVSDSEMTECQFHNNCGGWCETRRELEHNLCEHCLESHDEEMAEPAPSPQSHAEPIAWMVGTAIWWTKEEAERDAAETGLPIVGLGPMTDSAEVERLRKALKFYADRDHFAEDIGSDWDSVSGEPANVLWHENEAWFVEDGSIARAALERRPETKSF